VLIHGLWHDGSAWTAVIEQLRARGHNAYAPTVAGHGKGVHRDVGHRQAAQSVLDFVMDRGLTDFVLVGHSAGGVTVCKTVELISDRIRRLVFCDAFILADGDSLTDNLPPQLRAWFDDLAAASFDGSVTLPPFDVWRESFMNDADIDLVRSTYAQLSPAPYRQGIERIDLKKFYTLTMPRSYIFSTEDTSLPHGEWGYHPGMTSRLGLFRFLQMPGGHEVIFTNPSGLADKIIEAGRD
jgi:pimeloyl-ACP methyl ester carboxylesterase